MSSSSNPLTEEWDPFLNKDVEKERPRPQCLLRIKRDLSAIYNEPPPGLYVVSDDSDITIIHALITGSFDTPYEGGFFYFILRYPPEYPIVPPRVKLMTTGGGQVRFNPNLYKNGKVCLSILGTWHGPCWSPAQSLSSVLISIQSVLNEKPYHNEPGFEQERIAGDVNRYNDIIQHETLRVAVCGMLENEYGLTIPQPLKDVMRKTFLQLYDCYESIALKKIGLTGMPMQDPFSERRGRFQYKTILSRLRALRAQLSKEMPEAVLDSNASSPTSEMDPEEDDADADAVATSRSATDARPRPSHAADVLEYTCIASTSKAAGEPQITDKSSADGDDPDRQVTGAPLRL